LSICGARALAALCLVAGGLSASAQTQNTGLDALFPGLRVGMWVKVEGVRTSDGSLDVSAIKVYAGELDEVEVVTAVTAVDAVKATVQTAVGVRVVTTPDTKIEGPEQQSHLSLASLEAGRRVKIEGQLQKDGSLLAEEIDMKSRPDLPPGKHALTARIESIDTAARRIVLMGLPAQLRQVTRIRTPLPD
jgi:hypothetical protein